MVVLFLTSFSLIANIQRTLSSPLINDWWLTEHISEALNDARLDYFSNLRIFNSFFSVVHYIILYCPDMYRCMFSPSFVDCSGWKELVDEWVSATKAIAGKN